MYALHDLVQMKSRTRVAPTDLKLFGWAWTLS